MNADLTRIAVVLDRSGSMESIREATISGFNEFLNGQRLSAGTASVRLNQFDNVFETVFDCALNDAPELTRETFVPRGPTALLDAIGRTIHELGLQLSQMREADRPGKVIVVIVTDGAENSSTTYSLRQVNESITHQREKYGWEFLFLGANQDAIATAASVGIPAVSAMQFSASPVATQKLFAAASRVTRAKREKSGNEDFTAQERSEVQES